MSASTYLTLDANYVRYRKSRYSLSNIKFRIRKGSTIGIVGESGSGKSTIGKILAAAMNADEVQSYGISDFDCELFIDEPELTDKNILIAANKEINTYRKHVQYIFQNHRAALNMNDTVYSSLLDSFRSGNNSKDVKGFNLLVHENLSKIGLIANRSEGHKVAVDKKELIEEYPFLDKRIRQLSGGQMKRISILKCLLFSPDVIIADEPLTGLDASKKGMVLELLNGEKHRRSMTPNPLTTIIISHDIGMIKKNCDMIYVMFGSIRRRFGMVIETIQDKRSLENCAEIGCHPYTAELLEASEYFRDDSILAKENSISVKLREDERLACLYYSRCGSLDDTSHNQCLKAQVLTPSHLFPNNEIACHKCIPCDNT